MVGIPKRHIEAISVSLFLYFPPPQGRIPPSPSLLLGVHSWISSSLRRLQKESRCLTWSELRGRGKKEETLWSNFQLFLFAGVLFSACLNGFPGDDGAGVCKWICVWSRAVLCCALFHADEWKIQAEISVETPNDFFWKLTRGKKRLTANILQPLQGHLRVDLTLTPSCFKSWKLWAQEI